MVGAEGWGVGWVGPVLPGSKDLNTARSRASLNGGQRYRALYAQSLLIRITSFDAV